MLIVNLETAENGSRANQVIFPGLEKAPEGWGIVPAELEEIALQFLPWMTVETSDGLIVGVGDDTAARERAQEMAAGADAEEAGAPA